LRKRAAAPPSRLRAERTGTEEKLVEAAMREFNERGYSGTDTNRIARRAGFAPQTFYRWFDDKDSIFIRVYERWQQQEAAALRKLVDEQASDAQLVSAVVKHHKDFLVFRRSLRRLACENDTVRAARAQSRLRQIAYIKRLWGGRSRDTAELAATLLQAERLSDAIAEGELRDMGLGERAAEQALAAVIRRLRTPG
jgi:AcrR family transcriptional regulator